MGTSARNAYKHTGLAEKAWLQGLPAQLCLELAGSTILLCHGAIEAGSPHARCALVEWTPQGWQVEMLAIPYDHASAVEQATINDGPEWETGLRTGFITEVFHPTGEGLNEVEQVKDAGRKPEFMAGCAP
jgi:hypothetical protein